MQPNIKLQYRSSSANSWVGMGWSLNPGYIVRSTKLGPPIYDDIEDTFLFVTDSGTTELVYLLDSPNGRLYQARIESSFAKFYKEGDGWRVVQKDGTALYFGETDESKEFSDLSKYGLGIQTFLWNMTKIKDANGNYISLSYQKFENDEKSYLDLIEYTGHENDEGTVNLQPTNRIEFVLEDREDKPSNYISGNKISISKRLKEIFVSVNGECVWHYVVTYKYSHDTNRSVLESIKQFDGTDANWYPQQTFTYQSALEESDD